MKKNKYKKNQNKRKSRHHVIPSSRGGSSKLENIAIIDKLQMHFFLDSMVVLRYNIVILYPNPCI